MESLVRRLAIVLLGAAALIGALMSTSLDAAAGNQPIDIELADAGVIDVLQVSGLFDDIIVNEIDQAIERAIEQGSIALILQVDSAGSVVDDAEMAALLERIAEAPIPIAVWVGPSTAQLIGRPAQILAVADVTGMAPGARVGHIGTPLIVAGSAIDFGEATEQLRSSKFGLSEARELGIFKQRISDEGIATIANMVDALDGFEHLGQVLNTTTETISADGVVQRDTIVIVRFNKPGLTEQLLHTVASPPVTYLLLLAGLALLIFEFFTAGVGIAGGVGAVSLILSAYGLAALPTNTWAIGLIVAAMVAFAIDVQVGIPRLWTGIGIVLTIIGSWFLFEPLPGASLRPSWITLIAGIGGVMLMFIVGMPSMVRTRFATPTIGREWMIGTQGVVVEAVAPDGLVEINDSVWRARTNRATPVEPGSQITVVAIDGYTLEVEPITGAARDYREHRSGASGADQA
jgi:membrane-bound serine protease (ClpP class)